MSYATDDSSGPVGYVKLTASGPNGATTCPAGTGVVDANSTPRGNYCYSVAVGLDQPLALKPWSSPSIVLRFASKSTRKGGTGTANLNGSLLCDSGRTLTDTFSTGCYTTYGLNYDEWGTAITPACTPGVELLEGRQVRRVSAQQPAACAVRQQPTADLRRGQERPGAGLPGRHLQPLRRSRERLRRVLAQQLADDATQAATFFNDPADGGYDFTNDPRYITLIITDNTAFSSSNTAEPVKYFAGFYATGWDTGNGSGKPKGCYDFPLVDTCGAPNNDRHPFLGCLAKKIMSADNGDMWGHFVKFVAVLVECHAERQPVRAVEQQRGNVRRGPGRVAAAPSARFRATTIGEVRVSDALADRARRLASSTLPSPARGHPFEDNFEVPLSEVRICLHNASSAKLPGEGGLVKLDHPTEGSLTASPRWSGGVRHRRQDESGQAMVEFALILFPLLIIVAGIIQFGIGLNYWLDMQPDLEPGRALGGRRLWPGSARRRLQPDCSRHIWNSSRFRGGTTLK